MTTLIEQEIFFDVLTNPGDTFYENVLSDFRYLGKSLVYVQNQPMRIRQSSIFVIFIKN
jgi:hypothetical protein